MNRSEPIFSVRVKRKPTPGPAAPKSPKTKAAEAALAKFMRERYQPLKNELDAASLSVFRAPELAVAENIKKQLEAAVFAARREDAKGAPKPPPPADNDLSLKVLSFEFEESEKKADQLTLTLDNRTLEYFDDPDIQTGNVLFVTWGYAGNTVPVREVVIRKITGGLTLKVVGQSKAVLMNRDVRSRVFEHKTRSDVVRAIAEEHGYGKDQQHIADTGVVHEHVAQARLTDAQFIKRLADIEGFEFYVDHQGFHWKPRNLGKKPLRVLQYFLPPDVGDIVTFDVENDLTAKPGSVTVQGRDPLKKEDIKVTADNASTPRTTLSAVVEVVDPKTGATEQRPLNTSSDTKVTSASSATDAKREADGAYKRAQLAAVQMTMTVVGDPSLHAKAVVDVRGMGKRLSGKYYVQEAKHKVDASGYLITLKLKTDGGNARQGPKAQTAASQNKQAASTQGGVEPFEKVNNVTGATSTGWKAT